MLYAVASTGNLYLGNRRPFNNSQKAKIMNQSIITKYLPATNTRGSRIKAISSSGKSITVSLDYSLTLTAWHIAAMRSLCEKLKWAGEWHCGAIDGYGYVFVKVCEGSKIVTSPESEQITVGENRDELDECINSVLNRKPNSRG